MKCMKYIKRGIHNFRFWAGNLLPFFILSGKKMYVRFFIYFFANHIQRHENQFKVIFKKLLQFSKLEKLFHTFLLEMDFRLRIK